MYVFAIPTYISPILQMKSTEYCKYPIAKQIVNNFEARSVRAVRFVSIAMDKIRSPGWFKFQDPLEARHTGELSMLWRLFLLFLMWLLSALESRGLRSSKLQSSSPETDMTAPQLSNSPQYCRRLAMIGADRIWKWLTFGAEKTVTSTLSVKNS